MLENSMDLQDINNNNNSPNTNGELEEEVKSVNFKDDGTRPGAPHGDGASAGKIFVGGLSRETTSAQFVKHFGQYGEIIDSVIMKDRKTGHPRGFGFVTYADHSVVDKVIGDTHIINGKQVEIKLTIPKGSSSSRDFKTKKIFVGGISASVDEDEFRDFFMQFGEVKEHQIMRDHSTSRSRGFGFITFDSEQSVDDLLASGNRLELGGSQVEIKKAEPKKVNPPLPPSKRYDSRPSYDGGYGNTFGGEFGGGSYGGGYRGIGGAYGARGGGYGGYVENDFSGFGGYGNGGIGAYREDPSMGYSARYGAAAGFSRGYDFRGGYGGPDESYGGYSSGGAPNAGGYAGGYDMGLSSGYAAGGGGRGSLYGSRGGYDGSGSGPSGRYHPYGR